ncbi:MAG: metallophosphoesterase, partial [Bacteroidales bacterium]|nr:metallophosphoesterase [Bacteroidales bacterium]
LLCGDLIDGEVAPLLRQQLGKHIQEINTPLGLYAVSGNHEYIGNIETALSYLESIHIKVLQDEVLMLPNGIQLIGCKDIQSKYADPKNPAKPLETLLENIDNTKPVIVMKHQPLALDEAADAGVDLHLSGHTHHGQMWPINYITNAIYELSWGYMKKKNTHFYVTSGFGSWGPSVRLGNYPEVVVFTITFNTIN